MSAVRFFPATAATLTSPGEHAFEITPSNEDEFAYATRGLYIGSAGDVALITVGGETITFTNMAAGVVHPIRAVAVKATGTTATNLVGIY